MWRVTSDQAIPQSKCERSSSSGNEQTRVDSILDLMNERNEKWGEDNWKGDDCRCSWLISFIIVLIICTMFRKISPCIASSCRVFLWMNAGDSRVASHLNVHSRLTIRLHALGFIFYDIISSFSPSPRLFQLIFTESTLNDFSLAEPESYLFILFYLHLLSRVSCLSCSVQLSKVYVKYKNEKKSLSLSVIYNLTLTSSFQQFTRFIFFPFRPHTKWWKESKINLSCVNIY